MVKCINYRDTKPKSAKKLEICYDFFRLVLFNTLPDITTKVEYILYSLGTLNQLVLF